MNQPAVPTTNSFGQPVGQTVPEWRPLEFPEKQPLDGRFCRLEPLDAAEHAESLFNAVTRDQEGRNWTYLPYGPFDTFKEYHQWVDSVSRVEGPQFYAVVLKSTGQAAGVASYLRINPANGSMEVGDIHLTELIKRSPAATEAMFLMMKRVFDLGYRRYEWKCDVLNAASCSAAQRLGLSFEGVFRQATVYKGRNRDTAWFAAVDADWPALEQAYVQWLDPENFGADCRQRVSLRGLTRPLLKRPAFPDSMDIVTRRPD